MLIICAADEGSWIYIMIELLTRCQVVFPSIDDTLLVDNDQALNTNTNVSISTMDRDRNPRIITHVSAP
jgi:hypothetical protein